MKFASAAQPVIVLIAWKLLVVGAEAIHNSPFT